MPNDVQYFIEKLLSKYRPDIDKVFKMSKRIFASKKSVVDALMQSMETYMNHLEEKVAEHTMVLMTATVKMKELLWDVLPFANR